MEVIPNSRRNRDVFEHTIRERPSPFILGSPDHKVKQRSAPSSPQLAIPIHIEEEAEEVIKYDDPIPFTCYLIMTMVVMCMLIMIVVFFSITNDALHRLLQERELERVAHLVAKKMSSDE
jgi:hypothetical protein